MSRTLASQFADAAAKPAKRKPKRCRPSSLSIRMSDEERAILERKAGKRSIGAYVREKVLGGEQAPRRKGASKPAIDTVLLGQVLGKLGKSEQVAWTMPRGLAVSGERDPRNFTLEHAMARPRSAEPAAKLNWNGLQPCNPAALAKSGGSKGKEAPNEGPPPKGVETFGCLARARGEAP